MNDDSNRDRRATVTAPAMNSLTADPDLIGAIRLNYRLAKQAEATRIMLDQQLASYVRVYLTAWTPAGSELSRAKANTQTKRAIETIRKGKVPSDDGAELCEVITARVIALEPTRVSLEDDRKAHRKQAEKLTSTLPVAGFVKRISGFSIWGVVALIGEAGDLGLYPGCRHLYKRLGLAPNECYATGEKKTGRKIPRATRGRVMGIIADPLLRAQRRAETDDEPARSIGPYGKVYGDARLRAEAGGKTKGHAHNLARRAMLKALIHDVHQAWRGESPDFLTEWESQRRAESLCGHDLPSPSPSTGSQSSHCTLASHSSDDQLTASL